MNFLLKNLTKYGFDIQLLTKLFIIIIIKMHYLKILRDIVL